MTPCVTALRVALLCTVALPALRASEEGSARELWRKGNVAKRASRMADAAAYFERAARLGHRDAQTTLGVMYLEANGVDRSPTTAFGLLFSAAKQGQPHAMAMVAKAYYDGTGVGANMTLAAQWFERAVETKPMKDAQFMLAICYQHGHGVRPDLARAVELYRKSAAAGLAEAQAMLAKCLLDGSGTDRNVDEAVEWFGKAIEQDHPGAQFMLGKLYMEGKQLSSDKDRGLEFLLKAAGNQHQDAMGFLADCYSKGIGVQQNQEEAVSWWNRAVRANPNSAQQPTHRAPHEQFLKQHNQGYASKQQSANLEFQKTPEREFHKMPNPEF